MRYGRFKIQPALLNVGGKLLFTLKFIIAYTFRRSITNLGESQRKSLLPCLCDSFDDQIYILAFLKSSNMNQIFNWIIQSFPSELTRINALSNRGNFC